MLEALSSFNSSRFAPDIRTLQTSTADSGIKSESRIFGPSIDSFIEASMPFLDSTRLDLIPGLLPLSSADNEHSRDRNMLQRYLNDPTHEGSERHWAWTLQQIPSAQMGPSTWPPARADQLYIAPTAQMGSKISPSEESD